MKIILLVVYIAYAKANDGIDSKSNATILSLLNSDLNATSPIAKLNNTGNSDEIPVAPSPVLSAPVPVTKTNQSICHLTFQVQANQTCKSIIITVSNISMEYLQGLNPRLNCTALEINDQLCVSNDTTYVKINRKGLARAMGATPAVTPQEKFLENAQPHLATLSLATAQGLKQMHSTFVDFKNLKPVGCGKAAPQYIPNFTQRIINGKEAKPHSWPWQMHLNFIYSFFVQQDCGGSLIRVKDNVEKTDVVLTAAHCATKFDKNSGKLLKVYDKTYAVAGMHDKGKSEPFRQRKVSYKSVVHPLYKNEMHIHEGCDVALVIFQEPFIFTDTVRPICLPKSGSVTQDLIGKNCWTTGWGAYNAPLPYLPATAIQQMKVNVITDAKCTEKRLTYNKDEWICGRDENASFYIGDSGGPLQCQEADGSWTIYGTVSYGGPDNTYPMMYARISKDIVKWIKYTVGNYSKI